MIDLIVFWLAKWAFATAGLVLVLSSAILSILGRSSYRAMGKAAAACGVGALLSVVLSPPGWTFERQQQIEKAAEPVIRAVKEYRSIHGSCPPDEADIGVELPQTPFGTLEYRVGMIGTEEGCELRVARYRTNGFAMWWNTKLDDWYIDR